MVKKFVAGILALTLVLGSAALPNSFTDQFTNSTTIKASADDYDDYDGSDFEDDDVIICGDYKYVDTFGGTAMLVKYTGKTTDIVIPDTLDGLKITSLYNNVFTTENQTNIVTSVVLPKYLKTIGYDALSNCSKLTSVTIPDSVTRIESYAFNSCTALKTISIPDSVEYLGSNIFYECTGLTNAKLPASLTVIPDGTFEKCTSLSSITIPKGTTKIGVSAFYGCYFLTDVTIPDSVSYIGLNAFNKCMSLKNISISDKYIYMGESVFDNTEWYNSQADGMVYLGKSFYCYKGTIPENTSIVIKDGTLSIAGSAFCTQNNYNDDSNSSTTRLTSISLPNSLKSIGESAFYGCTELKSIDIPDSVTTIGTGAISNCTSLTKVKLPKYLTNISDYLLYGCSSLTEVVIPKYVTDICCFAFQYCTSLKKVVIPNSVYSIQYAAFSNCTSLTDVKLNDNINSIELEAFLNCTNLKSVEIPEDISDIGPTAFGFNDKYEKINGFKIICSYNSAAGIYARGSEIACDYTDYIGNGTIKLSKSSYTYTGKAFKPAVTVTDGKKKLKNGDDYTVTYKNNVNAGTATVTIKGINAYAGSVTKTFKINPKKFSDCAVGIGVDSKVYNGKAQKTMVGIYGNGKLLKENKDYKVTYKNNKNVGKATVTVKGIGNFTGTASATFSILPKKQSLTLKAANNAFKATWKKDTQATRYQISYSTKSNFKNAKSVYAGKTVVSKTIKGKDKTKYYVRVRTYKTVSGKKIYGAWSTVKTVKTK